MPDKHKTTELISSEVLDRAEQALQESYQAALVVKGRLDQPYRDDPRWTPYTRWVSPAAKRAYETRQELRDARR